MRTLVVSENFPPRTGGSGRWFWEIYRRLPRADFVIAAGEHPRQEEFDLTHDLRLKRMPLTLPRWGVAGLREYWRAVRALRDVVRAERVSRIHCGRCLPEGLMALALKWLHGISYICYVHGEEVNYTTSSRELRWWARRVLTAADYVIVNSRNTARLLQDEWNLASDRLRLLYPGVDTERFLPAPRDLAVREQIGWGERPVLLTVGRLDRRKGQDQVIRALGAIRQTVPDILYVIVGGGEDRIYLEDLVNKTGQRGHVQFLGELTDDDLVRCYQQCDLFVLANRQVGKDFEGFGMVLLEAQACGKPVVAGASGGTAETMHIPETGVVVPCEEPDALAALLAELLVDRKRRESMGQVARNWVIEHFDWATLSREAAQLFRCELGDVAEPNWKLPLNEEIPEKRAHQTALRLSQARSEYV
jgi:phosphatidylinositol alpha-1,6-mannosyltransferase